MTSAVLFSVFASLLNTASHSAGIPFVTTAAATAGAALVASYATSFVRSFFGRTGRTNDGGLPTTRSGLLTRLLSPWTMVLFILAALRFPLFSAYFVGFAFLYVKSGYSLQLDWNLALAVAGNWAVSLLLARSTKKAFDAVQDYIVSGFFRLVVGLLHLVWFAITTTVYLLLVKIPVGAASLFCRRVGLARQANDTQEEHDYEVPIEDCAYEAVEEQDEPVLRRSPRRSPRLRNVKEKPVYVGERIDYSMPAW